MFNQKNKKHTDLILYAFASHSISGDIEASYYPEINAISIKGGLSKIASSTHTEEIKKTIAHELGHFFIFNHLSPKELINVANKFGSWNCLNQKATSFFDPIFLKPFIDSKSNYMPSHYAKANIHEWFSEAFSEFLFKKLQEGTRIKNFHSANLNNFDKWMITKLGL